MRGSGGLALLLFGCSAIIDPDPGKLGGASGTDAGGGGVDADIMRPDAGPDAGRSECDEGCDDGVPCTLDRCEGGRCVSVPTDDFCDEGETCNRFMGCVPEGTRCSSDAFCDDGDACNGAETCADEGGDPETGCVAGAPLDCGDPFDCTVDSCDPAVGCVHEADHDECNDDVSCTRDFCSVTEGCQNSADDDLCDDGFCFEGGRCTPEGCVGSAPRDCRDGDVCTADSCDPVASMCVNEPRDDDGDGFAAADFGGTVCADGDDCDDGDPDVNPGAEEECNGVDDDCDDVVDEGCALLPEDCETAEQIILDGSGDGRAGGSMALLGDDLTPTCDTPGGGRDAVYFIEVDTRDVLDVTIETTGSAADTLLSVASSCDALGTGREMVCNDDQIRSMVLASRVWVHRWAPTSVVGGAVRRLYFVVDTFRSTDTRDYEVRVRVRPARPDACGSGGPLDISGGGSVWGRFGLGDVTGDTSGSCQPGISLETEAVFRFDPVRAQNRFVAESDDFVPDLYVREACRSADSEVDCVVGTGGGGGGRAELRVAVEDDETSYVFVDGAGSNDTYTLDYEPEND